MAYIPDSKTMAAWYDDAAAGQYLALPSSSRPMAQPNYNGYDIQMLKTLGVYDGLIGIGGMISDKVPHERALLLLDSEGL